MGVARLDSLRKPLRAQPHSQSTLYERGIPLELADKSGQSGIRVLLQIASSGTYLDIMETKKEILAGCWMKLELQWNRYRPAFPGGGPKAG